MTWRPAFLRETPRLHPRHHGSSLRRVARPPAHRRGLSRRCVFQHRGRSPSRRIRSFARCNRRPRACHLVPSCDGRPVHGDAATQFGQHVAVECRNVIVVPQGETQLAQEFRRCVAGADGAAIGESNGGNARRSHDVGLRCWRGGDANDLRLLTARRKSRGTLYFPRCRGCSKSACADPARPGSNRRFASQPRGVAAGFPGTSLIPPARSHFALA